MEVDSPTEENSLLPQDQIVQRLLLRGVPVELLSRLQPGFVAFVNENRSQLPEFVSAILPTDKEVLYKAESGGVSNSSGLKCLFRESLLWLQWLMFEDEPRASLKNLSKTSFGQRGVCGAVWGHNDIRYHCRTCEHDQTCAICVPCFQNGNHKDHDYFIKYTGSGCCDCGDVTAWKREGFCSKHKGTEQIQPLPEKTAKSVGPVLDVLLIYWKDKLLSAESVSRGNPRVVDHVNGHENIANELTLAVVEMLHDFCKHSESLLSFISKRVFLSAGLLDILVRAERFLDTTVVKKLHELLLKLLGEPIFKYEFAKVYVNYYQVVIKEAIKECSDSIIEHSLLNTFSAQIFTVPTLSPRLVKEANLLGGLLGCLGDIFLSCAGEDDNLQVSRWENLYKTTVRVVEDTYFVMSHVEVSKYITHEQPDIARAWIGLLAFVQGMNPQKRVTVLHIEEENENMHMPFMLGHFIGCIHSLLVAGAFPVKVSEEMKNDALLDTDKQDFDDIDGLRYAKVGRLSQGSSVCSTTGRSSTVDCTSKDVEDKVDSGGHYSVPSSVSWLTFECLRAIDNWLVLNVTSEVPFSFLYPDSRIGSSFSLLKRTLSKIRKGKHTSEVYHAPSTRSRLTTSSELHGRDVSSSSCAGIGMRVDLESQMLVQDSSTTDCSEITEMDLECASGTVDSDENILESDSAVEVEALRVLSLSDWPHIIYDVSSQAISVHIPLHRLLSVLLQKSLRSCYPESVATEINDASSTSLRLRRCHDFFRQVLADCHPNGFSAFIMEHPLRIKVFCAQVHAGMWQKNGDAAIVSCELYRSVRWFEQCLELDLFLMQCCAALAPPDLYVQRIIECFGLSNYLSLNLEQRDKYEPVLVQEMLTLIIQIVKERRFCGLSTAESLQRELVYKLAIGDATHSQLVKSLPPDLSKSDQIQKILDAVAVYSNPSGMKQGKYSLRKSHWQQLDLYHPRWNSRDLQIAEERYLHFCKVSALTNQLPRWTKTFYPLEGIARIATSKTVLQIVRAVLFYAVFTDKTSASRAPDGVILTALHLLSLSLDICNLQRQSGDNSSMSTSFLEEESMPVLSFACEEVDVGSTAGMNAWMHQSMLSLLVSLMRMHLKESLDSSVEVGNCSFSSLIEGLLKKLAELDSGCMSELQRIAPEVVCCLTKSILDTDSRISAGLASEAQERKAKARRQQAAMLEKMRDEQSKFIANLDSTSYDLLDDSKSKQEVLVPDDNRVSEDPAPVICSLCRDPDSNSPVSFLILLQKSRLVSFVERGPPSWEHINQSGKEHPSFTTIKNAVNEARHDGLPGEVDALLDFLKAQHPTVRNNYLLSTSTDTNVNTSSFETMEEGIYESIQRDLHDSLSYINILPDNQKSATPYADEQSTGSGNAESALLGKHIASLSRETSEPSFSKISLPRGENASIWFAPFDGFGPWDCDGIHASSCGHAVHEECRDRYLLSLKEGYNRRAVFEGGHIVDADQGELLCPVCRRLANSVLPALPDYSGNIRKQIMPAGLCSTLTFGSSSTSNSEVNVLCLRQALALLQSTANMVGKDGLLKPFSSRNKRMRHTLKPVFRILSKFYFADTHQNFGGLRRFSYSMVLWDTLRYSLIATEISARGQRSYTCKGDSISGLYEELESSSGFILSLLLQFVQSMRSEDAAQVLPRFRGIQLFAESICSGVSIDEVSSGIGSQGGDMLSIMKHLNKRGIHPDIQLWKRAADPIVAHDPFSSLMLVLFCLPRPFLSSVESFLPLVHLFYAVCVIQAVITSCGTHQLDFTKLQLGDCPIIDICRIIGESVATQEYFVSNYIDSACHPKEMIRRFTFPYLRRCALLCKLLSASMLTPFCEKSRVWGKSSPHTNDGIQESTCDLSMELEEIEQLEKTFKIPSLDVVLKDGVLHTLVLKWFNHFLKVFEVRSYGYGRALHSTPAVPFKLMCLPNLYQDLLQRYIKQQCPDCKAVQDEPALCLLCGRLCSPTWKSCCRESSCQNHAMACGAGIGVFLLVRRTTILLQRSARQSPWPSPYLDAFGEEDTEMHRGKPLYLHEERYAALTHMVASHGLDRSSEVLRQTTIDAFLI